jgi:hypothetical protein
MVTLKMITPVREAGLLLGSLAGGLANGGPGSIIVLLFVHTIGHAPADDQSIEKKMDRLV